MADIFDPEPSTLLCDESQDLCFDDLEVGGGAIDDDDDRDHDGDENPPKGDNHSHPWANADGSEPLNLFPSQSEEDFASLIVREIEYLPKQDYLSRLRCGELDLGARREAFDWICKAHSFYSFGPLSLCLAVNYLDRFLSIRELPRDKAWAVQLLAVACLSIAAKIEETTVPQSIELQVGDPKYVFEAKTIQRMELLVLDTLSWKMNAVTPCSFLEYSLNKLNDLKFTAIKAINRSMQIILCIIRGIDFLEFKPSEIAIAVAMSVGIPISCFIQLEKDRVLKCVELIKDMSLINNQSPIGVLDSACFSYKSDELTTRASANSSSHMNTSSSSCSPETKRKKLDTTTSTSSGYDSQKHIR